MYNNLRPTLLMFLGRAASVYVHRIHTYCVYTIIYYRRRRWSTPNTCYMVFQKALFVFFPPSSRAATLPNATTLPPLRLLLLLHPSYTYVDSTTNPLPRCSCTDVRTNVSVYSYAPPNRTSSNRSLST